MAEPRHLEIARSYVGFREKPDNRGIEEFIGGAKTGRVGDAWCAIFANYCIEKAGQRGTRSALARSFERDANFVRLEKPRLGCVVTFWRNSAASGQGHVGFYLSDNATEIEIISGNDDDEVKIAGHPKARFTGYWWPKALLNIPATAAKRFTDITATVFADEQVAYQDVRPGWNDRPGVALPFFFEGVRPQVRVFYRGKSVVCDIVDQGPWNRSVKSKSPGDPYWETGSRPLAEKQFAEKTAAQNGEVPTNKAGIDLTPAAADAIGLPGKGLVDWEFVTAEEVPVVVTPTSPTQPVNLAPLLQALGPVLIQVISFVVMSESMTAEQRSAAKQKLILDLITGLFMPPGTIPPAPPPLLPLPPPQPVQPQIGDIGQIIGGLFGGPAGGIGGQIIGSLLQGFIGNLANQRK